MKFKLHYNSTHANGERFCHQDNLRGGCTTVIANVTCKKCLRSMLKEAVKNKKLDKAGVIADQILTTQIMGALGLGSKLMGLDNK